MTDLAAPAATYRDRRLLDSMRARIALVLSLVLPLLAWLAFDDIYKTFALTDLPHPPKLGIDPWLMPRVGLPLLGIAVPLWLVVAPLHVMRRLKSLKKLSDAISAALTTLDKRLNAGEAVKPETLIPAYRDVPDEFGEVGHAFCRVGLQAGKYLDKAALNAKRITMVTTVALRLQTMSKSQLEVLDRIQKYPAVVDELHADVQRVDHIGTRERCLAEYLLVINSLDVGRRRREPVPIYALLREATSIVGKTLESYQRVQIINDDQVKASIHGWAATEVVMALGALINNGVDYSARNRPVMVTASFAKNGLGITIADSGLGMSPHDLDAANQQLANPPLWPLAVDAKKLGLYVVSKLAHKNGFRVTLRPRPSGGGTEAIMFLPWQLIAEYEAPTEGQPGPGADPVPLARPYTPPALTPPAHTPPRGVR